MYHHAPVNLDLDLLFDLLEGSQGTTQMTVHHPEGDVFTHSLQVLHIALRESDNLDLILAGMLHDVGKVTYEKGHDITGYDMLEGLVSEKTRWLVRQHMRFWYFISGEMNKYSKVRELAEHPWLGDLATLARWDKKGRNPRRRVTYDRIKLLDRLKEKQYG